MWAASWDERAAVRSTFGSYILCCVRTLQHTNVLQDFDWVPTYRYCTVVFVPSCFPACKGVPNRHACFEPLPCRKRWEHRPSSNCALLKKARQAAHRQRSTQPASRAETSCHATPVIPRLPRFWQETCARQGGKLAIGTTLKMARGKTSLGILDDRVMDHVPGAIPSFNFPSLFKVRPGDAFPCAGSRG